MVEDKKIKGKSYLFGEGKREVINTTERQKIGTAEDMKANIAAGLEQKQKNQLKEKALNAIQMGDSKELKESGQGLAEYAKDLIASKEPKKIEKAKELLTKGKSLLVKSATKGLKSLPILGAVGSVLAEKKAEAAIPIFGDSEELGPKKGSEGYDIENPKPISDKEIIINRIKNRLASKK